MKHVIAAIIIIGTVAFASVLLGWHYGVSPIGF